MIRPTSFRPLRASRGFTLVELMVTVAIAAILGLVAVPSLRGMVATAQLKGHNGALQESLMLARSEAIKRGVRVVLCKSADQAACAGSGDWQQGWIVFVDTNDSASVDPGEAILHKVSALHGPFILQSGGNVTEYVSYTATGAPKLRNSQNFQAGVFTLCRTDSTDARQIELFPTGRLTVRSESMASCPAT